MTGYTSKNFEFDDIIFNIDIRSVNSRYGEVYIKTPYEFFKYEAELKKVITKQIKRGKISVFISCEYRDSFEYSVDSNEKLANSYLKAIKLIKNKLKLKGKINIDSFLKNSPEIFNVKKDVKSEDLFKDRLIDSLGKSVEDFNEMRSQEGDFLKNIISENIDIINKKVIKIEELSSGAVEAYKHSIKKKMQEILADIPLDENRILEEAGYVAAKSDITEEIVRLKSHVEKLKEIILISQPVGKKIDFIVQEMNREVNTIGSKSNNSEISEIVIDLKCEVEKIREQIQNIE
jgi:uncharacterized protein (TIGR00255 family)